ncbi:MAG: cell wall hydrolase, partial [Lachnospiraceae bacterium]|nr:cell wall hydrolase [Lachnospiraceae bacterium]
ILVANVVLNRLENDSFPDTVEEVVFQECDGVAQFSPVTNGRYESAKPKEDTIEAVEAALMGEDYSEGALYFMARKHADYENVEWFDSALDKVVIHGGHEFYK